MKKDVKFRLIKHMSFLENELKDYETFKLLSWKEYNEDRNKRRNVERWVENIINSSIDIAKIILMSEGLTIPDTYKEIVTSISSISDFDEEIMARLSRWVRLRNIISHEYIDIRWSSVRKFIDEACILYNDFSGKTGEYLERKIQEEKEKP